MQYVAQIIKYFKRFGYFWAWVLMRFYRDRCLTQAAALSFTSLLALFPFVAVLLSVFSHLPWVAESYHRLQDFAFHHFMPRSEAVVQAYLAQFAAQVSQLSIGKLALLTFTAMLMIVSIEGTLNAMWGVRYTRHFSVSLALSWAMLTLGPFLLCVSWLLTSDVRSWIMGYDMHVAHILRYVPWVMECLGCGFLYWVIPHCTVRISHALCGGLFATLLFEVGREVFAAYVIYVSSYTLLYGALAVLPLFLLWVYCSWSIFLLGAEVVNGLRLNIARG